MGQSTMALRAASRTILVTPSSVDNNETELPSGLQIIEHSPPERKVWRGIVENVGPQIQELVERGDVVHYLDFVAIGGLHAVVEHNIVAFEDRDS